jgi:hypothetical protein
MDGAIVKFPNSIPKRIPSGGGGNMEARVAKLESDVEYIKADISDIKADIREMKKDHRADFRMVIGMQFTTILGVIGILIKVFS